MSATPPPYLTDAEIDHICAPLVLPGAQCKFLQKVGLLVVRRPSGKPLVARSEFERVVGAARLDTDNRKTAANAPDFGAMASAARKKHGAKAQG